MNQSKLLTTKPRFLSNYPKRNFWMWLVKTIIIEIRNPHGFYRYIHFAKFTNYRKLMSVKKQIPSLCKLFSFYEEIPENFSDETDADSCFYHNIFDFSQSQHRIVWVSRGSNKKIICNQVVPVLRFKDTATLYPPRRSDYLQKRTHLFGRQSAHFSQNFWSS